MGSSAPLTFTQLEQLWTSAGGSAAWAPTMAAIAALESGGQPTIQYPSNLNTATQNATNATGLWQIEPSDFPGQSIAQLENPATNAADAVALLGKVGPNNRAPGISNWQGGGTADPLGSLSVQQGSTPLPTATLEQALNARAGQFVTGPGGLLASSSSAAGGANAESDFLPNLPGVGLGTQPTALQGAVSQDISKGNVGGAAGTYASGLLGSVGNSILGVLGSGTVAEIAIRACEVVGGALLMGVGLSLLVIALTRPDQAQGDLVGEIGRTAKAAFV